jgi:Fe-Mn family superoxide dismutase
MNKRKFLKQTVLVSVGVSIAPSLLLSACKPKSKKEENMKTATVTTSTFELPEIPYGYNAFPDTIDARTMEIHHTKHHQGYTNKLNAALKEENISGKTIEEILNLDNLPTAIRNNGGGYYNHSLYWDILTPGGTMSDNFKAKINKDFGSQEAFMSELSDVAANRFGSGWAWVLQDNNKKLHIFSTPNQDNPLMKVSKMNGTPILGIDVWEHAYYLKYQNKRGDYLKNILNIINWERVEDRMV